MLRSGTQGVRRWARPWLVAVALITVVSPLFAQGQQDPSAARPPRAVEEPGLGTSSTTPQVSILFFLVDLIEVVSAEQRIEADVVVEASWSDPSLAGEFDYVRTEPIDSVWHPVLLIVNQRSASRGLPEVVKIEPDGTVRYRQRFTGDFSTVMDLREFPFDSQTFEISLVALLDGGQPIAFSIDTSPTTYRNSDLTVPDWTVGNVRLKQGEYRVSPRDVALPNAVLEIDAVRKTGYYTIQVLVPLIAIVLMVWTVFWIPPQIVATRITVVVTTMLTVVAYSFALQSQIPPISYLSRLDYFLLTAIVLVIMTLFLMAGTSYLSARGRDELVDRIDRTGRWLYPLTAVGSLLAVWLL